MKTKYIITLLLIMATVAGFGQTFDYSLNYKNIKVGSSSTGALQFNGLATFVNQINVPDISLSDSSSRVVNSKLLKQAIQSSRFTAGYGMSLMGQQFRVDTSLIATKKYSDSLKSSFQGQYVLRKVDTVYILADYDATRRIKIKFNKCMVNELMTFSKIEIINSSGNISEKEFYKSGLIIADAYTDYIGPYRVDFAFVGGNHLLSGDKTAKTSYFDFLSSGKTIPSNKIIKLEKLTIRVTNEIFDPHFTANPNPPTDIVEQVLYTIENGKIEITLNSTIKRTGLTMQSYYGPQGVNINLNKLYVSHSSFPNGFDGNFANSVSYGSIASYPNIEKQIWLSNDKSIGLSVWIDRDYGLGKTVNQHNDTANSFVQTSNNKSYYYLIGQEQTFNNGDVISWHGGYNTFLNEAEFPEVNLSYTENRGLDKISISDFISASTTTNYLSLIGQENKEYSISKKDNSVFIDDPINSAKGVYISSSGYGNIYLSTLKSKANTLKETTDQGNFSSSNIYITGASDPLGFPNVAALKLSEGSIESYDYQNIQPKKLNINVSGGDVEIGGKLIVPTTPTNPNDVLRLQDIQSGTIGANAATATAPQNASTFKSALATSLKEVTDVNNKTPNRLYISGSNNTGTAINVPATYILHDTNGNNGVLESFDFAALVALPLELNPSGGAVKVAAAPTVATSVVRKQELDLKADISSLSGYVPVSGNTSVTGIKTFTEGATFNSTSSNNAINASVTTGLKAVNASSTTGAAIYGESTTGVAGQFTSASTGSGTTISVNNSSTGFLARFSKSGTLVASIDNDGNIIAPNLENILPAASFSHAAPPTPTSTGAKGSVWYDPTNGDKYIWYDTNKVARHLADPTFN